MEYGLEICVDSLESALNAQLSGASRVEYCDNLTEGGTTPSYGSIAEARKLLKIGLHVLIRPRGGDFLYSDNEFNIMKHDIELCKETGVDGIVTGILLPDGRIDTERTAILIAAAAPMSVTFHRAFDMCADPFKSLEDIISAGADRLLTSGQKDSAEEGSELICELIKSAAGRIKIMPGGGINETNAEQIVRRTGAIEIHLTGRSNTGSGMIFRRNDINMGIKGFPEYTRKIADPEKIKKIRDILKML